MTAPGSLWEFSLSRYGRPGVADICLRLQDAAGVDVNLLLACLWCAQHGAELTDEAINALAAGGVDSWREDVVKPLRTARRAMKHPPAGLPPEPVEALRTRLKAVEIEAERQEQLLIDAALAHLARRPDGPVDVRRHLAAANMELYAARLGCDLAATRTELEALARDCID